jgi:putative endopeptidase
MISKIRPTLSLALLAALATPAVAMPMGPGADPKVRPQDDLFRAVNGQWLDGAKIPGDKKAYGTFMILREKSNENVRGLLEEAAKNPNQNADSKLVGNFYASMVDEKSIERQGLAPIAENLTRIAGIKTLDDVSEVMAELGLQNIAMPVETGVGADAKKPTINAVYWAQGGLGLPNRDYYLKTGADSDALRKSYVAYLTQLNKLAGVNDAAGAATAAMEMEMAIAKIQWSSVERRDAVKTYNPAPRAKWDKDYPGFPWARFAAATGMPLTSDAVINEPSFIKSFAEMAPKTKIESWKSYLRTRLLDTVASDLPKAFRDANFAFKGQKLQGLTAAPPRWRTAVEASDSAVGEAIGSRYVAKYFPPADKARMKVLVTNLLGAYKDGITNLTWMAPATRKSALEKLAKLRVKIGYADKWRGYPGLDVRRGDAVGNLLRSNRYLNERDMAEAGKPVDRSRWDMTPQTVNAYYNPVGNEIVFPAAILQPPFFDPKADDGFNYGAIGAVIGHETSHGFDDQGRRYDADGRLRDWWTSADEKNFSERSARLVAQYSSYEPLPGQHVDGKLTLGENIADLAGLTMALNAYHRSLHGRPAKVMGGLTGDQRFFLGFARVWRSKSRPEWMHTRLVGDPHSPEQFRTNGVVTNVDAFYDAFGLKAGDKLYKKPADRVHIW